MIITELKVKENITSEDIAEAIEFIANSCFINGNYNPYYRTFSEKIAIMRFFLDGIQYEDGDSWLEMSGNNDIERLINTFYGDPRFKEQAKVMSIVNENATEVIEFRKQKLIHGAGALEYIASAIGEFKSFINDLDVALGNLIHLDLDNMTPEDIKNAQKLVNKMANGNIVETLKEAANFNIDKAAQEIIDAKNAEIENLRKQLADKEKSADVITFKKESDK